jgi:hypothetical protein
MLLKGSTQHLRCLLAISCQVSSTRAQPQSSSPRTWRCSTHSSQPSTPGDTVAPTVRALAVVPPAVLGAGARAGAGAQAVVALWAMQALPVRLHWVVLLHCLHLPSMPGHWQIQLPLHPLLVPAPTLPSQTVATPSTCPRATSWSLGSALTCACSHHPCSSSQMMWGLLSQGLRR